MASSRSSRPTGNTEPGRLSWLCVLAWGLGACAVGSGEGQLEGWVDVEKCATIEDYQLDPTFFGASALMEDLLEIRVQRGSGVISENDGVFVLVRDSFELQQELLGQDLPVDNANGPVGVTFYLNRTCPLKGSRTPVALPATGGTARFDAIYASRGSKHDVEIAAELVNVTFEDPRNGARAAELSGYFRFLYQRGRPAQIFP